MVQLGFSQNVVWGDQPGQGDFDGGMNGWTTAIENPATDSMWVWDATGDVSSGALAGAGTVINSPTGANGAMVLNYDFLVSGGDGGNLPPFPYPDMISHLISPQIDLSSSPTTFLSVKFNQLMRRLNAVPGMPITGITFSNDDGATWFPDTPIDCNPTAVANGDPLNNEVVINIPAEVIDLNVPIRLRFTYAGDFYYWVVDDVQILKRPSYNLSANSFFSIAPNAQTPAGQMANAGFLIDVENIGSEDMTNVDATVEIRDNSGALIFTDVLNYGTLTADTLAENQSFPNMFPTDLAAGNYSGTYTISGDSTEFDPDDNMQSFEFSITDSTFAKESGSTRGISPGRTIWDAGELWNWGFGNVYLIPNGDGMFARTVSFMLDNPNDGSDEDITGDLIFIKLYQWVESGGHDGVATPSERFEIGSTVYTVQLDDNLNKMITVILRDPLGEIVPIPLADDSHYFATVEYFSNDSESTMSMGGARVTDYNARIFQDQITDSTMVNYASILLIEEDILNSDYSATFTFGASLVPVVRLNVGTEPIMVSGTEDIPLLADNALQLSPNPATDFVNVQLNLTELAEAGIIEVISSDGKSMNTLKFSNVQNETTTINVSDYSAGTYYLRFTTKEGMITKPFQVIK